MSERISDERLQQMIVKADEGNEQLKRMFGQFYEEPKRYGLDIASALRELAELREQVRWIPVTERLPELTKEQRKPNSFGVPVLIAPWYGGDGISPTPFAYFGTRVYDTPCFYIYGRQVFPDYWRPIGPLPGGDV